MSRSTADTRERILQTARKLLEAGQGQNVRISDIAKGAGISRQAVYLHFDTRATLLIETARYIDEVNDVESRLAPSRAAKSGNLRLDAYVESWGNYMPEIYGIAKAFWAMGDADEAASAAWQDRMNAVRHGCAAAIHALSRDGHLSSSFSPDEATDMLSMLLSVRNWEQLTQKNEWSQQQYIKHMKQITRQTFVVN